MARLPQRPSHPLAALVALIAGALLLAQAPALAQPPPDRATTLPASVVGGYFASWDTYDRGYDVADIPGDKLNVLLYAFAKPRVDAATGQVSCTLGDPWADYQSNEVPDLGPMPQIDRLAIDGHFKQLLKLRAKYPHLRVLISLGGATDFDGFSQAAATPELRRAFVASCVDLFIRGNLPPGQFADVGGPGVAAGLFDGIDIDWEVPGVPATPGVTWSDADKANYPLLLQEFRDQLDAVERTTGRDYLLTAAVPVYAPIVDAGFDVPAIVPLLDLIFLMTYDLHGPFDGTGHTDHNAPLHFDPQSPGQEARLSVAAGLATWQTRGAPDAKLVLGMPFYGRQYAHVGPTGAGQYQPYDNAPLGGPDWNNLTPTYHDLVDRGRIVTSGAQPIGQGGFVRHWNQQTSTPWLYSAATQRFISYDDPASIGGKTQWAIEQRLAGVFTWKLGDDAHGHPLLDAMGPMLP